MKRLFRFKSSKLKPGEGATAAATDDAQSVGSVGSGRDLAGSGSTRQYRVDAKAKDFSKLHKAAWNNDAEKARTHAKKLDINLLDKEYRRQRRRGGGQSEVGEAPRRQRLVGRQRPFHDLTRRHAQAEATEAQAQAEASFLVIVVCHAASF
ncbi:PREDICTED: uncharacterized protein LOC106812556 [Priapulus caudatus]|uniref:Uncharacterized protein LOC106812556 n=1 Tax=Priapulus caudatus TaxID=37621 RepID=A0ABM1EIC0_PRICU|nr:PREDICTED: uncharacterized protein LOC106812556 [Priapulus caudatus]